MKRIFSILLVIALILAGCSKPVDKKIASDTESFKVFKRLFGEQYLYALSGEDEYFIRQNLTDGYVEILAFTSRRIFRYELKESLKYTTKTDSEKLEKAHKRRFDWAVDMEPVFTSGNLSFIIRDETLLISVGNKSGNISTAYECPIISSAITPQIRNIVSSGVELLKVIQEDNGEFYLCSDYTLAYIIDQTCSVYRYNSVATFQIGDELPKLVNYDFPSAFFGIMDDTASNSYIMDVYGLSDYDIIIAMGDYYLCSSIDGKAQLLYNRKNNFYEWVRSK